MGAYRLNLCAVALAGLVLLACGGDNPDPEIPAGARLEFVSEQTQNLRFAATADLTVAYLVNGEIAQPIEGASLDWEIVGTAGGSSLAATQSTTDANGESTIRLAAGSSETTFRVRVTPPEGDSIEFQIGVADFDAGSILVELEYAGERMFNPIETFLYNGQDCGSIDPNSPPTAIASAVPVARITDNPAFANVEAMGGYTVLVIGRLTGEVSGFGCTENITVATGEQTTTTVTIADLEIAPGINGVYELQNRLDFAGTLPGAVGIAVNVLDEFTDDNDIDGNAATEDYGQDPGAFVVDFAMRQTCAWECTTGDFDTCEPINHPLGDISLIYEENFTSWDGAEARFFGGCGAWETIHKTAQEVVNDQFESIVPAFATNLAVSLGDIARAINDARINSRLIIFPGNETAPDMRHDLDTMEVTITDLDGMEMVFMINLRDAGFRTGTASFTGAIDGDAVTVPMHTFDVNFGELVQFIYTNALLPALGYSSTAEMLSGWLDCAGIASWVQDVFTDEPTGDSTLPFGITEEDIAGYCTDGLVAAGAFIDTQLASIIPVEDGTLSLMGTATAGDYDERTMVAQSLGSGMWAGDWGESAESEAITGTFMGSRTGDAPAR